MIQDQSVKASKLLIPSRPVMLIPALAVVIGLNEAIFLQQLHYWLVDSKHFMDGRTWVYNTITEWQAQLPFWNERTLRRVIKSLATKNLISVKQFNKGKCDRTNWYSINFDEVKHIEKECEGIATHFAAKQTLIATKRRARRGQYVHFDEHNLAASLNTKNNGTESNVCSQYVKKQTY